MGVGAKGSLEAPSYRYSPRPQHSEGQEMARAGPVRLVPQTLLPEWRHRAVGSMDAGSLLHSWAALQGAERSCSGAQPTPPASSDPLNPPRSGTKVPFRSHRLATGDFCGSPPETSGSNAYAPPRSHPFHTCLPRALTTSWQWENPPCPPRPVSAAQEPSQLFPADVITPPLE